MSKDLAASRSGFMVEFLVDFCFLDFSDFSSLKTDFGLSIGNIDRNTRALLLDAQVTVQVANLGQISMHFRSAWWSDVLSNFISFDLPSLNTDFGLSIGFSSWTTQFVFLNVQVTVLVADRAVFLDISGPHGGRFLIKLCVLAVCNRSGSARVGVAIVIAVLPAVVVVSLAIRYFCLEYAIRMAISTCPTRGNHG